MHHSCFRLTASTTVFLLVNSKPVVMSNKARSVNLICRVEDFRFPGSALFELLQFCMCALSYVDDRFQVIFHKFNRVHPLLCNATLNHFLTATESFQVPSVELRNKPLFLLTLAKKENFPDWKSSLWVVWLAIFA